MTGLWREVIDRAGGRCQCQGACGRKHKDDPAGRCTRKNTPAAPLHAVPRQPVTTRAAVSLPADALHALCGPLPRHHRPQARRRARRGAARHRRRQPAVLKEASTIMAHPAPAAEASRPAAVEADTSNAAGRDASRRPRAGHDASHAAAAERDASCPDPRDPSPEGPRDTSRADAGGARRLCAWCGKPISPATRRDAVCCSVRCRQARHRFNRAAGMPADASRADAVGARRLHRASGEASRLQRPLGPLRLAYADPPYPGKAWMYRAHPDYAGEVDHAALIRRLSTYDGWALSTSAAALPAVLTLCPPGTRVAAWHRGERPARSRWPLNAWEPVIYHGGRPADPSRPDALETRRADSLVCGVSALTTLPSRVTGTKPAAFCRWVFDLLGAEPGDTLDDLFPGSGVVTRAWAAYTGDPSPAARAGSVAPVGDGRDASAAPGDRDASGGSVRDASGVATRDASPEALADDASWPTSATTDAEVTA